MAQINLLGTQNTNKNIFGNGYKIIARVLGVILLLIAVYYGYLYFSESSATKKIDSIKQQLAKAQAEAINQPSRQEALTRQGQIQNLNPLLSKHLYWSHLLPELAKATIRTASYVNIDAQADGSFGLTVTVPSYAELDKTLQVFDMGDFNKYFSNVKILSINKAQNNSQLSVTARLELTFDPALIKSRNR